LSKGIAEICVAQGTLAFEMIKELNVIPFMGFRLTVPGPQISISKSFEFTPAIGLAGFARLGGIVLVMRLRGTRGVGLLCVSDEFHQSFVTAIANHVSWRYVAKHRVKRLEPQSCLLYVAFKVLCDQSADIRNLLEPVFQSLWNSVVQSNRLLAHAANLRQLRRVQIKKIRDTLVVQPVI
jgi:hypothetical protein